MFCSFPMGLLFCSAASAIEAAMDPRAPMELSPATPNSARSIRRISARSKASATASVISHNWAWNCWEMLGLICFCGREPFGNQSIAAMGLQL